jgi:hypothetical protein
MAVVYALCEGVRRLRKEAVLEYGASWSAEVVYAHATSCGVHAA